MAAGPIVTRNQAATIYVGGFDEKVSEEVLWELFLQAGRVVSIHLPKDRISQAHQGYGFVELFDEDDADYAVRIMNMIKLYGKPIRVNKASAHQKSMDIGANLFVGNLDPEVDEKLIYDTFSAFGVLLQVPKIVRDPSTGNSRGFCFLHFGSFEASDAAIAAMHQQHLCNRAVSVSYAYRRDNGDTIETDRRHGSAAERLLAVTNPLVKNCRPNQMFADAPPLPVAAPPPPPPPPNLADTVAPPLLGAGSLSSGATPGIPDCPPPLIREIAVDQEPAIKLATVVHVPALPCALPLAPPPPPPPRPFNDVSKMKGTVHPLPINVALRQVLQSPTPLSPLLSYSPMKPMLPPPPPPPPLPYSPITSSLPPPPPPPPSQPSPSWNIYHHFQPPMQAHNRFGGQLFPQHVMSSPSQCPMSPQHPMNRIQCQSPVERRTGFMQGDRPRPPYWNEYQDCHRR